MLKITQILVLTMTSLQLGSFSAFMVSSYAVVRQQFHVKTKENSGLHMIDIIGGVGGSPQTNLFGGDEGGVELEEGFVVQITRQLKAYQVGKKAFGSFAEDKSFQPIDWEKEGGVKRADKCLVMPKGLRGVVDRVIDTNDSDASHPIYVKFVGGDALGGDYESPITFHMHMKKNELEVVDK